MRALRSRLHALRLGAPSILQGLLITESLHSFFSLAADGGAGKQQARSLGYWKRVETSAFLEVSTFSI